VQLHTVIDEYRVKAHELQAANEQVATINEALENANEELLGTNEELRATTEQLTSVNEQLEVRNDALVGANDDLRNLLTSVKIPILVVDRKRTIRLFTESAAELCELEDRDTGRPIGQIRSRIRVSDFDAMLTRVLEEFGVESCEGQDRTGHWHQVVIRPYKTADNQVNGAVISMTDIDAVKTTELRLRDARDYAQGIVETVREPLVVIDDHLTIVSANAAFYRLLQLDREDVERRTLWDVPATSWDAARLRATLERALADDVRVEDLQLDQTFPDVGTRNFLLNIRPIHRHGQSKLLLLAMEDVTDRRQAERLEARLVSGILRAQAGERERIAHELHDETGQALSALLVHLRTLEETIDASDARARVQRLRNDVRTCIENVRRLARGLHPATLADLGLLGAVKEIADAFTQTHGIPVHLTIEGEAALAGLAEEIALALFRVIQEALTNVARHAKAENVSLELGHDTVCVTILLHDDGIGFDSPGAKTGLGLVVMRRRIEELGGRLELRSVPGEGTSIQAQVPVPLQPGLQPISPR
jgi:two-component system CheB/CheR fusion protein